MKEIIHDAFRKEGVFVTSPLNYIVYESGFKAGLEYAQKTAHNSDYAKCHKHEFENIVCDMESALYAQHETNKDILTKSIKSVKSYINEHFV